MSILAIIQAVCIIAPVIVRLFGWHETPVGSAVVAIGNDVIGALPKKGVPGAP